MSTASEKGYTVEAIARAKDDCLEWLKDNDHSWVRTWEGEKLANYDFDFQAPPIAGYEALEAEGVVKCRGLVDCGPEKRMQFDKQ